eukprot:XP_016655734.1 PREDICTED: glyceraldehyde-3-phosphate dehydrogenase-like isoform X2 [Acyrthosiphon pisum]
MFKNAMRLISTGLRCMQGPSRVCSSSLINGDTFSRMGESVRQFSIQNSVNVSSTSSPPIAINGFGRIGKCVLLKALQENMNVVAINDPGAQIEKIASSLAYETVPNGMFEGNVSVKGDGSLEIDGKTVRVYTEEDPEKIRWNELDVEYVIETSGKFTEIEKAKKHLAAGVKKVIVAGPCKDAPMFVSGVNFDKYKKEMTVVSNASFTTNCVAPVINIINQKYGVENCLLIYLGSFTNSQQRPDGLQHKSALGNKKPSTTLVAKEVCIVIPELQGKVTGDSITEHDLSVSVLGNDSKFQRWAKPLNYISARLNWILSIFARNKMEKEFVGSTRTPEIQYSVLKLKLTVKKPVILKELKYPKLWEYDLISYKDKDKQAVRYFVYGYPSGMILLDKILVTDDKFVKIIVACDYVRGYSKSLLDMYNHMVKVDKGKPGC